jgi:hypothetical protein
MNGKGISFTMLIVMGMLFAQIARAQTTEETTATGLVLAKVVKTSSAPLQITTTPSAAFETPLKVACIALVYTKCALLIHLDTQVNAITSNDNAAVFGVEIQVDGSSTNISPNAVLGLDSTSTGGGSNARSFTWIKIGLAPGKHEVNVQFFTTEGTAASADRTLTVETMAVVE